MDRVINQDHLDTEFKQDYLNLDGTVAISAEGVIFKVGDVVHHTGTENKRETATISKFTKDLKSYDVLAHTERGFGRISFMYHPER
jgi:hypothetical protein